MGRRATNRRISSVFMAHGCNRDLPHQPKRPGEPSRPGRAAVATHGGLLAGMGGECISRLGRFAVAASLTWAARACP